MLQFSAYLGNKDCDKYKTEEPFLVHSCGRILFDRGKDLYIDRPKGRKDYQIIYIHQGKGHFFRNGEEVILNEGKVMVYLPLEEQKYYFKVSEHAEFYWLHFGGSQSSEVLKMTGMNKRNAYAGLNIGISDLFEEIIRELMIKKYGYSPIANLKGQELLWILAREIDRNRSNGRNKHNEDMERMIKMINLNYAEKLSVGELADRYGASTEWFIREFSKCAGMTPKQYINTVRLNHARELLNSSNYNIGEIAAACGFENPLYFSKYFKKKYFMTPSQYRSL